MTPQRSAAENVGYVSQRMAARGVNDAAFVRSHAGVYDGSLRWRGRPWQVQGRVALMGPLLFAGEVVFEVKELRVDQREGNFSARLVFAGEDAGTEVQLLGPYVPGRISGRLLPLGWTLQEYLTGERAMSDEQAAQVGQLDLQPVTLQPLQVNDLAAAQLLGEGQVGALLVDPQGNVGGVMAECELAGALSPDVSGRGTWDLVADVVGGDCAQTGEIYGSVYARERRFVTVLEFSEQVYSFTQPGEVLP